MTLRMRLFLVVGSLVVLVVGAQWWWMGRLADELGREVDEVAFSVGQSVAKVLVAPIPGGHASWIHCVDGDCREGTLGEPADLEWVERPAGHGRGEDGEEIERSSTTEGEPIVRRQVIERSFVITDDGHAEDLPTTVQRLDHLAVDVRPSSQDADEAFAFHLIHQGENPFIELAGPNVSHQIRIPRQGLSDKLAQLRRRTLVGSLGILLLGLLLTGVVAHRITAPLRRLAEAARRVGEGDWGARVDLGGGGEVGQAIAAFNQMSGRLAELDEKARGLEAHRHLGEIGEIARGLAHSLRNPLNALGLTLEELAARATGDESESLVVGARRQIRRIDGSIRSFLALASQGGGAAETVTLDELVQDVALEALQDAKGQVRIEVEGDTGAPHELVAVEPELRAVIQALMVNAVEASPAGGLVRAELKAHDEGRIRLVIEDQGPGLPDEIRRRLFTPHLSTKSHGSGMGLFLAHRIAGNRYGGRLLLEDGPTGGTRVVLDLGDRRPEGGE